MLILFRLISKHATAIFSTRKLGHFTADNGPSPSPLLYAKCCNQIETYVTFRTAPVPRGVRGELVGTVQNPKQLLPQTDICLLRRGGWRGKHCQLCNCNRSKWDKSLPPFLFWFNIQPVCVCSVLRVCEIQIPIASDLESSHTLVV